MGLERIECKDREEWLAAREKIGVGASEAAAICGMSPWMTSMELWRLKTVKDKPKDISDNAAVQQGVRMEPALRDFFKALHPEFQIEYHAFDILRQDERPHFFATLDGELVDMNGRRGILEIKTCTPKGKDGWSEWANGNMKPAYYVQVMAQFLATGYDFAYLFAALYSMNGDITLKEYSIDREDVKDDLEWVKSKQDEFWRYVETNTLPPLSLSL